MAHVIERLLSLLHTYDAKQLNLSLGEIFYVCLPGGKDVQNYPKS